LYFAENHFEAILNLKKIQIQIFTYTQRVDRRYDYQYSLNDIIMTEKKMSKRDLFKIFVDNRWLEKKKKQSPCIVTIYICTVTRRVCKTRFFVAKRIILDKSSGQTNHNDVVDTSVPYLPCFHGRINPNRGITVMGILL